MKTQVKKLLLIGMFSSAVIFSTTAQPPRGPRGGMDPSEMILREKQNLYTQVTDLSDDQKLLLDGIYDEFIQSHKEMRDEMRANRGDFESRRAKMDALRKEKDELIADVLNEEQYAIYEDMISKSFRRKRPEAKPDSLSTN